MRGVLKKNPPNAVGISLKGVLKSILSTGSSKTDASKQNRRKKRVRWADQHPSPKQFLQSHPLNALGLRRRYERFLAVERKFNSLRTPRQRFHDACMVGNQFRIEGALLIEHVDVDDTIYESMQGELSPIMYIAAGNNVQQKTLPPLHKRGRKIITMVTKALTVLGILIRYGANLEKTNMHGETALVLAARRKFHSAVDLLVANGAEIGPLQKAIKRMTMHQSYYMDKKRGTTRQLG